LFRSGSPRNAFFKGRHYEEYAWFAAADATPGLSIDVEPPRPTHHQRAVQHGQAELITPLPPTLGREDARYLPELDYRPRGGGQRVSAEARRDRTTTCARLREQQWPGAGVRDGDQHFRRSREQ
jgi:hypothetical protein